MKRPPMLGWPVFEVMMLVLAVGGIASALITHLIYSR